jgi:hypothetical protein
MPGCNTSSVRVDVPGCQRETETGDRLKAEDRRDPHVGTSEAGGSERVADWRNCPPLFSDHTPLQGSSFGYSSC